MSSCLIIIDLINRDEFDLKKEKKKKALQIAVFKRRGNHLVLDASENVCSFTPITNTSVIVNIIKLHDLMRMPLVQTISENFQCRKAPTS